MVKVTCLGGAGSVTGSNYLVESSQGEKVLVDCGLFQGGKQMEARNWREWDFNPGQINTLFLTHAHIDHSGRIPKLVRDGFKGQIITSPPTSELCGIMLLDAAHVQEMEAQWQTRKNKRKARKEIQPLYTMEDAQESLKYFHAVERDEIIMVSEGIRARLRNAGHILGSSILELWVNDGEKDIKLVFSGDIGKASQLILKDPAEIYNADYLFVESTYGNRVHKSFEESEVELLDAITYAVSNGEKILIPAFAVERTQEIIYVLGEFYRAGKLPDIPIYIDSPLAIKATEIFRRNKTYYDEEAMEIVNDGFDPFSMPNLHYSESTADSIAINENRGPAIVIAGSGMCTAGRIKHHLKHNLWRPGASIVIVGFQAYGTTGRKIVDGQKSVKIFQEDVAVRAKVFTIGGFSSHADQRDLLTWLGNFTESNPRVFVVHGEASVSEAFAELVNETFGFDVHVPQWREILFLKPKEYPYEVRKIEEAPVDLRAELLSAYADLAKEIEMLKSRIDAEQVRERFTDEDVDRMRYIQEEIQSILAA